MTSYRQLHSLSLMSVLYLKTTGQTVCSGQSAEFLSCGLIYRQFLDFLCYMRKRIFYYSPADVFFWKSFKPKVHPLKFPHMHGARSRLLLFTIPFVCICCVIVGHRTARRHMPLTVSLFLETAALVTLRLSHSATHTHTLTPVWGSLFLTLESNS